MVSRPRRKLTACLSIEPLHTRLPTPLACPLSSREPHGGASRRDRVRVEVTPGTWSHKQARRRPHRALRRIEMGRVAVLENFAGDWTAWGQHGCSPSPVLRFAPDCPLPLPPSRRVGFGGRLYHPRNAVEGARPTAMGLSGNIIHSRGGRSRRPILDIRSSARTVTLSCPTPSVATRCPILPMFRSTGFFQIPGSDPKSDPS